MAVPDIRNGDIGTELVVVVVDEDGAVVDISAATTTQILLRKPDGTVVTQTAVLDTTGTDGKMKYTTVLDDLDTNGIWHIQGYVVLSSSLKWHTAVEEFRVRANLG